MKYKVINSFVERNTQGQPTGRRPQPGDVVELGAAEAERLMTANCVVPFRDKEVERAVVAPPETTEKGYVASTNRTVNNRAGNRKRGKKSSKD